MTPIKSDNTIRVDLYNIIMGMSDAVQDIKTSMAVVKTIVGVDDEDPKRRTGLIGDVEDLKDFKIKIQRDHAYVKGGLAVATLGGMSSSMWFPKLWVIIGNIL